MTQQAREVSEFGRWVDHFEKNHAVLQLRTALEAGVNI
jgi:hypothetical protein